MTTTEVLVIFGGLVLGYWMVADWLSDKPKASKQPEDANKTSHDSQDQPAPPYAKGAPYETHWSTVLAVSPHATIDEIRSAYKVQMSQYHPDKVAALGAELRTLAERKSKEISTAYSLAMLEHGVRR